MTLSFRQFSSDTGYFAKNRTWFSYFPVTVQIAAQTIDSVVGSVQRSRSSARSFSRIAPKKIEPHRLDRDPEHSWRLHTDQSTQTNRHTDQYCFNGPSVTALTSRKPGRQNAQPRAEYGRFLQPVKRDPDRGALVFPLERSVRAGPGPTVSVSKFLAC